MNQIKLFGVLEGECCFICRATEQIEYHHFAPKHIFKRDAGLWPGAFLCKRCHDFWHEKMAAHRFEHCAYCEGLARKAHGIEEG